MITIRDVAKRAGVSTATVSNVLNGTRKASPSTEMKVRRAIAELHYVPDYVSRSRKCGMLRSIGVITEDIYYPDAQPAMLMQGVSRFCDQNAYQLQLMNLNLSHGTQLTLEAVSDESPIIGQLNHVTKTLESSNIPGILYIGFHPRNITAILKEISVPVTALYAYSDSHHSVLADDHQGGKLATEYLISKGHTRIGLISGKTTSLTSYHRMAGYQQALMEHGIPFRPQYVTDGSYSFDEAYKCCEALMSLPEPPTAIFIMSDVMAYGAMKYAQHAGIRIPEDLSIIGFDNLEFSSFTAPPLTTVRLPFDDMAYRASEILSQLIDGTLPEGTDLLEKIPCTIEERATVKAL